MRDLQNDLSWLIKSQQQDLSDDYLQKCSHTTRSAFQYYAPNWCYGITFVESNIAREWLERAIKAEKELKYLKDV